MSRNQREYSLDEELRRLGNPSGSSQLGLLELNDADTSMLTCIDTAATATSAKSPPRQAYRRSTVR